MQKYLRVQGWLIVVWETKYIDIASKRMSIDNMRLQILLLKLCYFPSSFVFNIADHLILELSSRFFVRIFAIG